MEQLKKTVYEQAKKLINRQICYLDNRELNNNDYLQDINLMDRVFSIKISKSLNDTIYLKYKSETKEIKRDFYNSTIEWIEDIQKNKIKKSSQIECDLIYKNKILSLDYMLINLGIKMEIQSNYVEEKEC